MDDGKLKATTSAPGAVDFVDELSSWNVGAGVIVMALFPLALPLIALTAFALLPLLLPLLAVALVAAVVAVPVLVVRRLGRWALRAIPPHRYFIPSG
jgi:predicted neutral ceramidase superfamily lipid hydrolase